MSSATKALRSHAMIPRTRSEGAPSKVTSSPSEDCSTSTTSTTTPTAELNNATQHNSNADPSVELPPLIPPFRFALVEEGVYRGAHPSLLNFRFLTRLNLRTVISLLPKEEAGNPSKDLVDFCTSGNIKHMIYELEKYDDGFAHTPKLVTCILEKLLDVDNHPIFMHCMDGRQNTGIVVMCLRKVQNWGLAPIMDEFVRYTKTFSFEYGEQNFVQTLPVSNIRIPRRLPAWFHHRVRPLPAPDQ